MKFWFLSVIQLSLKFVNLLFQPNANQTIGLLSKQRNFLLAEFSMGNLIDRNRKLIYDECISFSTTVSALKLLI